MELTQTPIPGCFELHPRICRDDRGTFVKTFHQDLFADYGLNREFAEEYYSYSCHGVLRGLHFQLPPADHIKVVYCVSGEVLDVVVDLRVGSPTYGSFAQYVLSAGNGNMLYIPAGLAHGYYVSGDHAVMMYKVATTYSPEHDTGILWNSAGIPWPDPAPILSGRDSGFVPLAAFNSPFVYTGQGHI